MSRTSMLAAMAGHRAPIFGIGIFTQGDAEVDFEIGWPEFERDVAWAHRMLAGWEVRSGDHVVMNTPNLDGPWVSPLVRALREIGAVHSNTEPYSWDSRRFA